MKLAINCLAAAAILGAHTPSGAAATQSGAPSHQHAAHTHEHAEVAGPSWSCVIVYLASMAQLTWLLFRGTASMKDAAERTGPTALL